MIKWNVEKKKSETVSEKTEGYITALLELRDNIITSTVLNRISDKNETT